MKNERGAVDLLGIVVLVLLLISLAMLGAAMIMFLIVPGLKYLIQIQTRCQARKLLLSCLSVEQKKSYHRWGGFVARSVILDHSCYINGYKVTVLDGRSFSGKEYRVCVCTLGVCTLGVGTHPIVKEDFMLAVKLLVEHAPILAAQIVFRNEQYDRQTGRLQHGYRDAITQK